MTVSKRTMVAAGAGAVALAAGLGMAGIAAADPSASPSASSSASAPSGTPSSDHDQRGGRGGHGDRGLRGELATALADKLGIEEAKVTEALQAVRADKQAGVRPDDAALATALAAELNLDEAKVKAALEEIRAEAKAERSAALKTRLDAAVQAGTLTQAEADAVLKAFDAGVIGGGGRR